MKFKRAFSRLILAALILSSCAIPSPTQAVSPLAAAPSDSPAVAPVSPIASPASPTTSPKPVTPQPGMGGVIGQLIDIRTGQPAYKTLLYLESTIEHQAPSLLYGPLTGQPKTDTLPGGDFAFDNAPPGEYILALYSPLDILYYQKPEGQAVLIQVKAGEVVDLGRIEYFIP